MGSEVGTRRGPGRRRAYRIVAAVLGLAVVGLTVPFTIVSFVNEQDAIHRMHNVTGLVGFGGLIGVLLIVTAWRPEENIAAFHVVAATALAGVIAGVMSGDLIDGGWLISLVAVVVTYALHPSRAELFRVRAPNLPLVALSVLAVVPGVAWALTQAELQRNGLPAVDPHAEFHHYSGMAAVGVTVPLVGLAAAFPALGERFARRFVGGCAAALGLGSLALSAHIGAFDPVWSWALVAYGAIYIALAELAERRTSVRTS